MKGLALDTTDGLRVAEDIKLTHSRLERLCSFSKYPRTCWESKLLFSFWKGFAIIDPIQWLLRCTDKTIG